MRICNELPGIAAMRKGSTTYSSVSSTRATIMAEIGEPDSSSDTETGPLDNEKNSMRKGKKMR